MKISRAAAAAMMLAFAAAPVAALDLPDFTGGEKVATKGKWEIVKLPAGCAALYHFTAEAELWVWGDTPETMSAAMALQPGKISATDAAFAIVLEGWKFDDMHYLGAANGQDVVALPAPAPFFDVLRRTRMLKFTENGYLGVGMQLFGQLAALDALGKCFTR